MRRPASMVLLCGLAGCAVAPTISPSPVASPSASVAAIATPTPLATQAIADGRLTHGTLYDGLRQPLQQLAVVRIISTDPAVTFDAKTTTTDGRWSIPDVPAGAIEVSVTTADWPIRIRRLDPVAIAPSSSDAGSDVPTARTIDFGGPYDARRETDQYYYLAPEIPLDRTIQGPWPIITPGATPSCQYAPPPTGGTTIMSGKVYDAAGQVPTGDVTMKVTSNDPSVPYIATTQVFQGSWVINSVPRGADITLTVSGPGYAPRVRTLGTTWFHAPVYHPYPDCSVDQEGKHVFNFGGPATSDDPDAPAWGLQPAASADPAASGT